MLRGRYGFRSDYRFIHLSYKVGAPDAALLAYAAYPAIPTTGVIHRVRLQPVANSLVVSSFLRMGKLIGCVGAVSAQFGNIVVMALYPEPHSAEWFTALGVFDPRQAATTRQILKAVGRKDVCSVCGDHPAEPLRIVAANLPAEAVASIRLCADCRKMRWQMYGEVFEPL